MKHLEGKVTLAGAKIQFKNNFKSIQCEIQRGESLKLKSEIFRIGQNDKQYIEQNIR